MIQSFTGLLAWTSHLVLAPRLMDVPARRYLADPLSLRFLQPVRCKACKDAKKARMDGGGRGGRGGRGGARGGRGSFGGGSFGGGGGGNVCYAFQKGECNRGE